MVDHVTPAVAGAADPAGLTLDAEERALRRRTHVTIRKVTTEIDPRMHLNTAISALMEMVNDLYAFAERRGIRPLGKDDEPSAVVDRPETAAVLGEAVEALVRLISPFTPHMAEELWQNLGHQDGMVAAGWPECDEAAAREESIEIPVQINGKVRSRVLVPVDATEEAIQAAAMEAVRDNLAGRQVVKVIVAKGRLVSIVVK
jgi:leucyl-tRNA synthetase